MLVEFAGSTQLQTEIKLLSFHISVNVVARDVGNTGTEGANLAVQGRRDANKTAGNAAHHGLERADAFIELALAAAARHREVHLERPVAFVVGSLQRGDDRRIGHTLELLGVEAVVLITKFEELILRLYGSGLMRILPVESQMQSIAQENHTCRVAVNTVEADGSIACRIPQKSYALVGIGKYSSSLSSNPCCQSPC